MVYCIRGLSEINQMCTNNQTFGAVCFAEFDRTSHSLSQQADFYVLFVYHKLSPQCPRTRTQCFSPTDRKCCKTNVACPRRHSRQRSVAGEFVVGWSDDCRQKVICHHRLCDARNLTVKKKKGKKKKGRGVGELGILCNFEIKTEVLHFLQ